MRTLRLLATSALLSFALAASAFADGRVTLGLTGGTLGVGPEVSLRPLEGLGLRGNLTWLGFKLTEDVDDIAYDGDVDLFSVGAMADWYPFDGGLCISAGVRWNGNDLGVSARPANDVTIGGVTYTPAEIGRLTGTVDANAVAPVVTAGWGGRLRSGFTVAAEAGFAYQGALKISNLRARGGLLEGDPGLLADLEDEEERIEREVKSYKYLPIAQIVLVYRF
ncbi:MAG: hypothetical protein FJ091_01830 [Deltaproteobacteria bacterium]|nr:hypothetical protein [Deltaproteobacteria bacterium]